MTDHRPRSRVIVTGAAAGDPGPIARAGDAPTLVVSFSQANCRGGSATISQLPCNQPPKQPEHKTPTAATATNRKDLHMTVVLREKKAPAWYDHACILCDQVRRCPMTHCRNTRWLICFDCRERLLRLLNDEKG